MPKVKIKEQPEPTPLKPVPLKTTMSEMWNHHIAPTLQGCGFTEAYVANIYGAWLKGGLCMAALFIEAEKINASEDQRFEYAKRLVDELKEHTEALHKKNATANAVHRN